MRIIFSGGGTGGHIFPAVAVAQEIERRYPDVEVLFIGALGKMEMTKVPKAGYPIEGLWISGFHRKEILRNLLFPFKLIVSLFKAFFIIRRFKPDAVAGFGGYASGAALYVASMMGKPILIQEQNSYPGVTNKILANRANSICVAYDNMASFFSKEKLHFTGNPIRKAILESSDRLPALQHFNIGQEKKVVLISGGSLGARSLNQAMFENHDQLEKHLNIHFIWQCGSLYFDRYNGCETAQLTNVSIMAFIDDMAKAYSAADIVISRAGALSVSELCVRAKPTILVPSPNVAEDHQKKNALALVHQDAAIIIEDHQISDRLVPSVINLLSDESQMQTLSQNIIKLARPNADQLIADELEKILKQR